MEKLKPLTRDELNYFAFAEQKRKDEKFVIDAVQDIYDEVVRLAKRGEHNSYVWIPAKPAKLVIQEEIWKNVSKLFPDCDVTKQDGGVRVSWLIKT